MVVQQAAQQEPGVLGVVPPARLVLPEGPTLYQRLGRWDVEHLAAALASIQGLKSSAPMQCKHHRWSP